jgi:deoxyribodipyrimidine photolyase-like uncharacterized protein
MGGKQNCVKERSVVCWRVMEREHQQAKEFPPNFHDRVSAEPTQRTATHTERKKACGPPPWIETAWIFLNPRRKKVIENAKRITAVLKTFKPKNADFRRGLRQLYLFTKVSP